jgi:Asp-tRNA(Asn)/Glu-tRNA(Gln) amidotransferase A subunit family amidase
LAGSVRVPAHLCGIVGLKPTNGAVAYEGQWPHAAGILGLGATVGPLARRVADVYLLFEIMSLRRRAGSRSFAAPGIYLTNYAERLRGRSFVWYSEDGNVPVAPDVAAALAIAVKALEDGGLQGRSERPPGVEHGPRLWSQLFSHAVSDQLAQIYAGHEDQAGPVLQAMFRQHAQRPAPTLETFAKAWAERDEWRGLLLRLLEEVQFFVAPVGAVAAWPHEARRVTVNDQEINLFHAFGHAQTFNVFGFPAVSVPVWQTPEGLPVGVQIVGRPHAEHEILAAATIIEKAVGGWHKPPYGG